MIRFTWPLAALAAISAPAIARAQTPPPPPYYAMDPHAPMNPSASSPLQQQILENYRTQLQINQRALQQQGAPGISRDQLEVNRQLNQYGTGPVGPVPGSGPPAITPSPYGTAPGVR